MNVLVLGVGGNVSQGILKALARSSLKCRVVGACIDPLAFGLYTCDRALLSPGHDDPALLGWLLRTCRQERIAAVLSGVEPVLSRLSDWAGAIRAETGAVCVVSPPDRLAIGADKLATCRWLEEHGFNFPRYAPPEDLPAIERLVAACNFPLIAKPRRGKGAQGLTPIRSPSDLACIQHRDYVLQETLGDDDSEYTAGCFSDRDGRVRGVIVLRRRLSHGTTFRAEAGAFAEVRAEAERIAAALRPTGPCNVQLRLTPRGPVCFEINVRFSGTAPVRARLGFNDVEAALRHYVLGEPAVDLPLITAGAVLRYWNELYVAPEAVAELRRAGRLDSPAAYPRDIEEYGRPA